MCAGPTRRWAAREDVALFRCHECGFVSGRPSHEMSAEERYETYHHSAEPAAPEVRYTQWLEKAERLVGRGRVLEIGAGSGGFVRAALARGWKVDANEVSPRGLEMLRRTGATVFAGDVASAHYPDGQFDLVVSAEVIEHLPAPLEHLREVGRVTRPAGVLILTTPNFDGLTRRWLGVNWRVIDPEHLGYFTSATLSRILREAGYALVDVRSRSLDVSSWRRPRGGGAVAPRFDPHASARLRDTVEGSMTLRLGKALVNAVIGTGGFGDSLIAWARK